ncbi:hypothetical protein ACXM2N_06630 [Corynebacterium sp. ZY180755]
MQNTLSSSPQGVLVPVNGYALGAYSYAVVDEADNLGALIVTVTKP